MMTHVHCTTLLSVSQPTQFLDRARTVPADGANEVSGFVQQAGNHQRRCLFLRISELLNGGPCTDEGMKRTLTRFELIGIFEENKDIDRNLVDQ